MRRLHAYSHYGDVSSAPTTGLAERIAAVAPMDDAVVFFASRRRRVDRDRRQDVPPLLEPRRPAGEDGDRHARALPTTASPATARASSAPRRSRSASARSPADTARVAWDSAEALAAAIDEIGPGARRRVLLRADHRRRRRAPPTGRLPRGRAARSAASATCCSSSTR